MGQVLILILSWPIVVFCSRQQPLPQHITVITVRMFALKNLVFFSCLWGTLPMAFWTPVYSTMNRKNNHGIFLLQIQSSSKPNQPEEVVTLNIYSLLIYIGVPFIISNISQMKLSLHYSVTDEWFLRRDLLREFREVFALVVLWACCMLSHYNSGEETVFIHWLYETAYYTCVFLEVIRVSDFWPDVTPCHPPSPCVHHSG